MDEEEAMQQKTLGARGTYKVILYWLSPAPLAETPPVQQGEAVSTSAQLRHPASS